MESLTNDLTAAGQHVSHEELILYIFGGLGPEFESTAVNLTLRESITLLGVQCLLQTHEMRIENQHSSVMFDITNSATT